MKEFAFRIKKRDFLLITACVFLNVVTIQSKIVSNEKLAAQPQPPDVEFRYGKFDKIIKTDISFNKDLSYIFSYDFYFNQTWATYVCTRSSQASSSAPLHVVVRQSLYVMSWNVPMQFSSDGFQHTEVCHTLCPLGNFFNKELKEGLQEIFIDFSTSSNKSVKFELLVTKYTHFLILTNEPVSFNITPTEPRVLEYHMPAGLNSVLVEAESPKSACMILAIQDITCPFYDSERTVEYKGFYQTMTRKSGITVTESSFEERKVYIVLILKPSDAECVREDSHVIDDVQSRKKEVTVVVSPSITSEEFFIAVFGAFGFFLLLYLFSIVVCCFLYVRRRKSSAAEVEAQTVSQSNSSVQTYGAISGLGHNRGSRHPDSLKPRERNPDNPESQYQNSACSDDSELSEVNDVYTIEDNPNRQISVDETDFDKLPDAENDKNVVRTKTMLVVSDLARKKEKYLSERTKVYSWNLLTVAVFYGLPVVQLVYINQKIVNYTGNQDLCYYNFLCSHKLWQFSDFNHVYSNIGYVMLGLLFLLLTWRREMFHSVPCKVDADSTELVGIPHHFGLFYAMGFALIMEGVLSASYHVCPNKANFQFDTAFMYVIATVCMLKLYQARHPDITAKSHHTWMILAAVLLIGVAGVLQGGTLFWIVFLFGHITITFLVSTTIYYMGRWKLDKGLFKRILQSLKLDIASGSFRPTYTGRFIMLTFAVCLNIALDLYGLIKRPPNFAAFLLAIFIVNLLMYLVYYTIMKLRYKERLRWIPIMYMLLSFLCWAAAMHYFLAKNTSWQMTPALSRERNKHCVMLHFYDDHDIWHFLSSCALFFAYMVLFTLDDDLETVPRSAIVVF